MNTVEKTVVIIKSDSIKRKLVGRILQKFEDAGLMLLAVKLLKPTTSQAKRHYKGTKQWKLRVGTKVLNLLKDEKEFEKYLDTTDALEIGERILNWSVEQLVKAPIIIIVLKGPHAIKRVKKITGETEPVKSPIGTIRGDFAEDSIINAHLQGRAIYNVVHRSSSEEEAQHEINIWFSKKEIFE